LPRSFESLEALTKSSLRVTLRGDRTEAAILICFI
jgi:hypothetical protein